MSDIQLANTSAGLSGKTVLIAESDQTVTGLHTYSRGTGVAPFAVGSGAAKVTNLDADLFEGQEGSYYTNASNLASGTVPTARLGSGSATSSTYLRGDSTWASITASPVTILTPTLADVANTGSITTALSAPISDWASGAVVEVYMAFLAKNSKGTSGTMAWNITLGGQTVQFANATWADNATERKHILKLILQRVGSDLWVSYSGTGALLPWGEHIGSQSEGSTVAVVSAPTFTGAQTLLVRCTPSASDANFYVKPQVAKVIYTAS